MRTTFELPGCGKILVQHYIILVFVVRETSPVDCFGKQLQDILAKIHKLHVNPA